MLICLFQLQWHRFLHVKLAIQVTIGSENVGTPNRQQAIIYTYNNKVSHLVKTIIGVTRLHFGDLIKLNIWWYPFQSNGRIYIYRYGIKQSIHSRGLSQRWKEELYLLGPTVGSQAAGGCPACQFLGLSVPVECIALIFPLVCRTLALSCKVWKFIWIIIFQHSLNRDKMADIPQTTFPKAYTFLEWKGKNVDSHLNDTFSFVSNCNAVLIEFDFENGLGSILQQTVVAAKYVYCIDELISIKVGLNVSKLHEGHWRI